MDSWLQFWVRVPFFTPESQEVPLRTSCSTFTYWCKLVVIRSSVPCGKEPKQRRPSNLGYFLSKRDCGVDEIEDEYWDLTEKIFMIRSLGTFQKITKEKNYWRVIRSRMTYFLKKSSLMPNWESLEWGNRRLKVTS